MNNSRLTDQQIIELCLGSQIGTVGMGATVALKTIAEEMRLRVGDAGSEYLRGFNDCRDKCLRIVDEHDGYLMRIEMLEPEELCANTAEKSGTSVMPVEVAQIAETASAMSTTETPPAKTNTTVRRTCNRHNDCDAAENEVMARRGIKRYEIHCDFHCHDEDCEDCFGK